MPDHQTKRQPASLTMNGGRGKKTQWLAGRCVVNRYEGEFQSAALSSKAETGLFYAKCRGTGVHVEGEGDSPKAALQDLKKRLLEEVTERQRLIAQTPDDIDA